jgi:hypothetical protein
VAGSTGGPGVFDTALLTAKHSTISDNLTVAQSDTGSASVLGGGVFNNTLLTLDRVVVSRTGRVPMAPTASRRAVASGTRPDHRAARPHASELERGRKRAQGCLASYARVVAVFSTFPVVRRNTVIDENRPEQCVGCSPAVAIARPAAEYYVARAGERVASGRRPDREAARPRRPFRSRRRSGGLL